MTINVPFQFIPDVPVTLTRTVDELVVKVIAGVVENPDSTYVNVSRVFFIDALPDALLTPTRYSKNAVRFELSKPTILILIEASVALDKEN